MNINMEIEAFSKIILHATKYPALGVNGILIRKTTQGKDNEDTNEDNPQPTSSKTLHIHDAIPLLHVSKYVTPPMEIALIQIEQYCKKTKSEVVGYYQANENLKKNSPDFVAQRIAEKLSEENSKLVVLMVNNELLDSNMEKNPLDVYLLVDGKLKLKDVNIKLEPNESDALSTVSALIQGKAYQSLIDFDNHLDDMSQDFWNNTIVTQVIKEYI